MGDPWTDLQNSIDEQIAHLHKEADDLKLQFEDALKRAKESVIFNEIAKLSGKVDALAARLPQEVEE